MSDKQTTDLERWRQFLASFNIGYTEEPYQPGERSDGAMLCLTLGGTPNVTGYRGFVTSIEFDASGRFLEIGAWE